MWSARLKMEYISDQGRDNCVVRVSIPQTEFTKDHTLYVLEVHFGECQWMVRRRYREFYSLHEQLVSTRGLAWELLPPKKLVGNLNPQHVERRRQLLENYLQNLVSIFVELPAELVQFLEVDRFDVNSVCNSLTEMLFALGREILEQNRPIVLSPLQIHCINRRLLLPLPTCISGDLTKDIGHLYDFLHHLSHLKVQGGGMDDTFIGEHEITYDFSIFKSLEILEIECCSTELITGFGTLMQTLRKLIVTKSVQQLKDILISGDHWKGGLIVEVKSGQEDEKAMAPFPSWESLLVASFCNNDLTSIDNSVALLKNVTQLDLSHNFLTEIRHLETLIHLNDLNVSYNEIHSVDSFPSRLGNVERLNLSTNLLTTTQGLERMYSLKKLDISNNSIQEISHVLALCNLPLLEDIRVKENPFCKEVDRRIQIFAQFGNRYEEILVDGLPATKRELSKIRDIILDLESYEIITDSSASVGDDEEFELPKHRRKPPASPRKSPRQKRKDRVVTITSRDPRMVREDPMKQKERKQAEFRDKIHTIQQKAGESWLSVLNTIRKTSLDDEGPQAAATNETDNVFESNTEEVPEVESETGASEETGLDDVDASDVALEFLLDLLRQRKQLGLPSEIKGEIEELINSDIDIFKETFLIVLDDNFQLIEHLLSFDQREGSLIEIDMATGETVTVYAVVNISDVDISYENGLYHVMFQNAGRLEPTSANSYPGLTKFRMQGVKDALCLYAVLKRLQVEDGYSENHTDSEEQDFSDGIVNESGRLDNPLGVKREILMGFYQDFVRQASSGRKSVLLEKRPSASSRSEVSPNYENIDFGKAFLKHDIPKATTQNVVLCLWLGCIPYLFPEEEIPICIVLTNINMFLFRVFLPESGNEAPKSVVDLKENLHCFYSFALRDVKEVVVGLYDQGFRIEVSEEGPRGTFSFLTRDASKTADFLETFCKILGIDDGNEITDIERRKSFLIDEIDLPSIVYPDEKKIKSLKNQLAAQDLVPFQDRENLISYSIVYDKNQEVVGEGQRLSSDTPMTFIRTLILTNLRLFLCEEDYVHWPLPSYIRSLPVTPEWVVDHVESVHSIIGVDVWEDATKYRMTGSYGLTLTFEDSVCALTLQTGSDVYSKTWNLMFESLSEREQFTRSLSCLWKNQFDQTLTVTYSKGAFLKHSSPHLSPRLQDSVIPSNTSPKLGHRRVHSGNVIVPINQSVCFPDVLASLDRARLNEYFRNFIATGSDKDAGVRYSMCVGCIPYIQRCIELTVAVLLSRINIYIVFSEEDKKYVTSSVAIEDPNCQAKLWMKAIKVSSLQQVAVGLFDQKFRLEGEKPEETFTIVSRNFEATNDFLQSLSQVLLGQPPSFKQGKKPTEKLMPEKDGTGMGRERETKEEGLRNETTREVKGRRNSAGELHPEALKQEEKRREESNEGTTDEKESGREDTTEENVIRHQNQELDQALEDDTLAKQESSNDKICDRQTHEFETCEENLQGKISEETRFLQRNARIEGAPSDTRLHLPEILRESEDRYTSGLRDLYEKSEEEGTVKAEFIHPNSHVKFVYPSDETLDKLKYVIFEYIRYQCTFKQSESFGVLLYALVFRQQQMTWTPCTLVLSERFLCLLKENHVDYPLPLFAKGLPDKPQYEVIDVRLLASIVSVEFHDLNSGDFSFVFGSSVEPTAYEDRFLTENVENDLCLVTDVNHDSNLSLRSRVELRAPSFSEREKIFHLISRLWANLFSGKNLPVIRKKQGSILTVS